MNWTKIGNIVPRLHDSQMVVIAEFQKDLPMAIRYYVGEWKEVKVLKRQELLHKYTHYIMLNKPKF